MSAQDPLLRKSRIAILLEGRGWWWTCTIVACLGLLSRLLFLADKPFHHDESLHGYYSHRVALGFPHEYSALLHGPVLYYFVGFFMAVFGVSDWTARLPAALCSVALVLLPLLWSRRLGRASALMISIFLLLSPTFMYFGRFLREDAFNTLWIAASLAGFFAYRWSGKPWQALATSVFLALQFCNKENAYLHVFVWLTGFAVVIWLFKRADFNRYTTLFGERRVSSSWGDRAALYLNCLSVFAVIYVFFYSSFFRHSKGALHGILDGLYRESLLYWWEQNQKRRIDGPFDYHSPLFFNYEFALIPALISGWIRSIKLASQQLNREVFKFPSHLLRNQSLIFACAVSIVAALALPRIGLTSEGCGISEWCAANFMSSVSSHRVTQFAQALHIMHSRHLLQIVAVACLGGMAVLATSSLGRLLDGFLWWWATGAVGIYSYVGEKVPWLLLYILMPLIALAGLEIGRALQGGWLPVDLNGPSAALTHHLDNEVVEEGQGRREALWIVSATLLCLLFSSWKAIEVSFVDSANPAERLVFTQTTPAAKAVRDHWLQLAQERKGSLPKISMSGDATWPMAWYAHDFPGLDFSKPANGAAAKAFDALFLDTSELDFVRRELKAFDVYKIPLRHWWVPQPNPKAGEIIEYFLTSRPYPRELQHSPLEQGMGDTSVLYLENKQSGRYFADAPPCSCGELVESARLLDALQTSPLESMPESSSQERKN